MLNHGKLEKFRALAWSEQKVLLTAMLLPLFRAGLRVFGLSRFQAWLDRSPLVAQVPPAFADMTAIGALANSAANQAPAPAPCLASQMLKA